jgi:putative membrane protein
MRKFIPAAALAVLAAGCASHNIGAPGTSLHPADAPGGSLAAASREMRSTTAQPYVMMAGASDLYEIQSSQIALRKAQRADVRQFANMLIQHHQTMTQQVMAAARAAGHTPPPPMLMPIHREMIAQLNAASPAEFDSLFLLQQVTAHELALNLHTAYAQGGDTPQLRSVAQTAVPIVTQHLEQARQMGAM